MLESVVVTIAFGVLLGVFGGGLVTVIVGIGEALTQKVLDQTGSPTSARLLH